MVWIMDVVGHWWNGTWGRLARLDVYLRVQKPQWEVELREGGAEGRSQRWVFDDEAEAARVRRTRTRRGADQLEKDDRVDIVAWPASTGMSTVDRREWPTVRAEPGSPGADRRQAESSLDLG
jgi:hypothetical protein